MLLSQRKFQLTASSHFWTFSVRFSTSLKKNGKNIQPLLCLKNVSVGCTQLFIITVPLLHGPMEKKKQAYNDRIHLVLRLIAEKHGLTFFRQIFIISYRKRMDTLQATEY